MMFDIIDTTKYDVTAFSDVQMSMLRSAQKKKNELLHNLELDLRVFRNVFLANGMEFSSLFEAKKAELTAECDRQVAIIAEQLEFSLSVSEPLPPESGDTGEADYIVDYSLSYTERYAIVRDYYLAIPDPAERMELYSRDTVAREYLGSYYGTLYNVLYSYSK